MRKAAAVALAVFAPVVLSQAAHAQQDAVIRASCSQDGRIVYREDFAAGSPMEKRILVAARHPGAMCVFLDVPAQQAAGRAGALAGGGVSATVAGRGDDAELAAALSIIAGGKPGDPYPLAFAEEMSKIATSGNAVAQPAKQLLNLTLGIYRGVPLADVMAHWKAMQDGTEVLARMTPTVNGVDGVTVISVEGVPDELAVTLCEEAEAKGAGCVAVY